MFHNSLNIYPVSSDRSDCGEGPMWSPAHKRVSWVDIAGKKWHQVELEQDATTRTFSIPTVIGAIVERESGGYFAAIKEGFGSIDATGKFSIEINFLPDDQRMNDAKVDSCGRFWAGSTAFDSTLGKGQLHVLDVDSTHRVVETGLALPNGLGWSPDDKSFYLVDSYQRMMWRYDFDRTLGTIGNRELLVTFPDDGSVPDGLSVTSDGLIIVAMWDGSRLEVFAPDGSAVRTLPMPVKRPTSSTFAGDTLIVTSAAADQDIEKYPLSGLTMAVEGLGYSGPASEVFRG